MVMPVMASATVSLDSCRSMAIRNNKAIRIADENIRGAGHTRQAAKSAYLPALDFTGGYMYSQHQIELLGENAMLPTLSFNPATMSYTPNILTTPQGMPVPNPKTGGIIPTEVAVIPKEAMSYDTHNVFAGAFTLTQPVFMGGQIRALNQITKYAEQMARSLRDNTVQEVIYSVDEAYWTVVSLREKVKLADKFVSLVDTLKYNVNEMYKEGLATRSDVLTVDVKYNEACITRTKAENGLSLSRMALAQLCGLPVDTEMILDDEQATEKEMVPQIPSYDMNAVYERRSDLEALRQGIKVLESREKLALGEMLPKIAAVGAWAFSNPNVIHGFEKSFGGGFHVGATLTIPLWHWGGNYNKYRAAKSNTAAQRMLLEDLEEKVDLQMSQAKYSYQEAFKTYDMTVNNLKSARENLSNAEYGFKEGVLTSDDVIAAQTAWLKANSENIDAQIGIRLCETYLSKVAGLLK